MQARRWRCWPGVTKLAEVDMVRAPRAGYSRGLLRRGGCAMFGESEAVVDGAGRFAIVEVQVHCPQIREASMQLSEVCNKNSIHFNPLQRTTLASQLSS